MSTPEPCVLPERPEVPAHHEYNVVPHYNGEQYIVFHDCVADGVVVDDAAGIHPEDDTMWDLIYGWTVTPAEPEVMVEEALARLNPSPPSIVTDPGGGVASLVNFPTYLSLAEAPAREEASMSDGPVRVVVWAEPVGEVAWTTGDGLEPCNGPAGPNGECAHLYETSSVAGEAIDEAGRPAFVITAEVAYTGGYEVFVNGASIGGDADIGGVTRAAETVLAVNEAQAINTDG